MYSKSHPTQIKHAHLRPLCSARVYRDIHLPAAGLRCARNWISLRSSLIGAGEESSSGRPLGASVSLPLDANLTTLSGVAEDSASFPHVVITITFQPLSSDSLDATILKLLTQETQL